MNYPLLNKFRKALETKLNMRLRLTDHMFEELMKREITREELRTLLKEELRVEKSKSCNGTVKLISSQLTIIIMVCGTIKTIYSQHNNH